jgi:acid stress-induced BolA-like protein IbaG/YrbA
MEKNKIKALIETALPGSEAQVNGDDGQHFSVTVIALQFVSLNRVQRQQRVYKALHAAIQSGELHAVQLKTWTPEEWQQQ